MKQKINNEGNDSSRFSNYYFVWNPGPYSNIMKSLFGEKSVILSEDQLDSHDFTDAKGIIILAELSLNGANLSDFYGFEILSQLRARLRVKSPIAMCSFMHEKWLCKKYPILDYPQYHPFIRLPATPETFIKKIDSAKYVDECDLNDIIFDYCDPNSRLIKLITHGKGFSQIIKGKTNKSFILDCINDLVVLENYINNKALNNTIISVGEDLIQKLWNEIYNNDQDKLLDNKSILHNFYKLLK